MAQNRGTYSVPVLRYFLIFLVCVSHGIFYSNIHGFFNDTFSAIQTVYSVSAQRSNMFQFLSSCLFKTLQSMGIVVLFRASTDCQCCGTFFGPCTPLINCHLPRTGHLLWKIPLTPEFLHCCLNI